ncbi:hypothetical protein GCM10027340_21810 [Marinomonas epiphytica]
MGAAHPTAHYGLRPNGALRFGGEKSQWRGIWALRIQWHITINRRHPHSDLFRAWLLKEVEQAK